MRANKHPKEETLSAGRSIGDRLIEARERQGWSQRELAEQAGSTQTAIGAIERGEVDPRVGTAAKLARALGVSPSWLAFGG